MASSLKGKDWYLARIKTFTEEFPDAVGDGMYQEALKIGEESQRQCPVEHGTLRQSMFITQPEKGSKEPQITIGYGTDYAVYVHERLGLNHPVGKAKYLEDPIIAAWPTWLEHIWRRASANIRSLTK